MSLVLAIALAAAPLPDAAHVLAFLNRTIGWYGRLDNEARLADQPTDVLYVNDNRQLAHQVVTLSFDFAKADAQLIANAPAPVPPANERSARLQQRADYFGMNTISPFSILMSLTFSGSFN